MNKKMNRILIFSMLLLFCFFTGCTADTEKEQEISEKTENELVKDLINLYGNEQENAAKEIEKTLAELKSKNEDMGAAWENIMNYWSYVNTEMVIHKEEVPTDLPKDDSFCTIVLGFKLNDDGTMQDELVKRLEAGLAVAQAYPESYIAVTGGGTSKNNPDVTEGGLMRDWLLEHGVEEERIIVEDSAPNTVGNAENTFRILKEQYENVDAVVIVTSDYHIPRASILFHSKFVLEAMEAGTEPIEILTNAAAITGEKGYESIELQAKGVASVAGVEFEKKQQ